MGQYDNIDYRLPVLDFEDGPVIKTRIDERVEMSLSLTYEIQDWLEAETRYQYVQNFSDFSASDFINNIWIFEISASY